jgi:hypothetical protein
MGQNTSRPGRAPYALGWPGCGLPNGQRYSDAPRATDRAAWTVVHRHCPDKTEPECREIIRTWVKKAVLCVEEYLDPIRRENAKGLRLDPSKRPG